MLKIDSHLHFWRYNSIKNSFLTSEIGEKKKDFLPTDFKDLLRINNIDGVVVIQSDNTNTENYFQVSNSLEYDFIKAIVGWIDLQAEDIDEQLSYILRFEKLKGFRHLLHGDKDKALMLKPSFMRGISMFSKYGFTYDLLIHPDQLQYVKKLVKAFPNQKFVINHMGRPYIKDKKIDGWKKDMQAIAKYENVYCKISGLVTEADCERWKHTDFRPYIDVVVDAFGMKRLMYGSDWPVCLLSCSYKKMKSIVDNYFKSFSEDEKDAMYGGNASLFYNLEE